MTIGQLISSAQLSKQGNPNCSSHRRTRNTAPSCRNLNSADVCRGRMSANGKRVITAIMGFSVAGSFVIAGPLMMNLDAARDGGMIQSLAMDSALWRWGDELFNGKRAGGGGSGDSNGGGTNT